MIYKMPIGQPAHLENKQTKNCRPLIYFCQFEHLQHSLSDITKAKKKQLRKKKGTSHELH